MAKMKDDVKREIFRELCQHREELKTNEAFVQRIINERLSYMPKKKLYKFRTCSNNNFKTLEENCIWMAPASSFNDLFDNTINIDLVKNGPEIKSWVKDNFPVFCFDLSKSICESKGIFVPLSHDVLKKYVNTCLDKNGRPILKKEREFIESLSTFENRAQIESVFSLIKNLRDNYETEDQLVDSLLKVINSGRTFMRDATLVYCMTERYDNSILWETYANNYTGFCIEYYFGDFTEKEFDDYKNLSFVFPMSYRKKKPYFDIVPFMDNACRRLIYNEPDCERNLDLDVELNMQFHYKHKDYEIEQEWRFSIRNKTNNKQYFPFVNAIYAGKDIKPGNFRRLCSIARKLGVSVYKQMQNKSNNGFEYIKMV